MEPPPDESKKNYHSFNTQLFMKKFFTLFCIALAAITANAEVWIVGNAPFGNWTPSTGMQMTETAEGSNIFTAEFTITGRTWFIFTTQLGSWGDVNSHRYGPLSGNEQVASGNEYTTQISTNDQASYYIDAGDYTITLDMNTLKFTVAGQGETVDPITGECYILGQLNGNDWGSDVGVQMTPANEEGVFTAEVSTTKQDDFCFFSFTTKHSENPDEWGLIAPYRFGAVSSDFLVSETSLGNNLPLRDFGTDFAFKIAPGEYTITVDLNNHTMKVDGNMVVINPDTGECYIMGLVNGNVWAANVGEKMDNDEEGIFTATIITLGEEEGYSYFNFTTKLADEADAWGSIDAYRFGAVTEGGSLEPFLVEEEQLGTELDLSDFGANPTSFKIGPGGWKLRLNYATRKLVITSADAGIKGDVNGDGEVGVADVTMLVSLLLEQGENENSDVNGDGETGVADLTALVAILMNKGNETETE